MFAYLALSQLRPNEQQRQRSVAALERRAATLGFEIKLTSGPA